MNFEELFAKVCEALRREQRISYRALRRRFELSDDDLEDITDELIHAKKWAIDEDHRVLVWTGETDPILPSTSQLAEASYQVTTQVESSTQAESPPIHVPEAERRQLTVMFCDLVGSTSLSGELDPEELREVVRAYQAACTEVITQFDGYVAQHLGDGLMVYFGWPQAHEDDAQRAIHAGLGIVDAMGGLNARLEPEKGICLTVRIGVHTGLVVVGEIGRGASQEHLALGETPNVASRIEGIARPDTVAISDATYQLIQGYFVCEELGPQRLKGMGEPQPLYRVVSPSGAQSRLDVATARGLTPLVGREQELGLLVERWEQVKDGQGQVVLLSGEAGIGKSRLIEVMRQHLADEPHTRLQCRSSPYYQNTALYPITDLLQRAMEWQPDDKSETQLEKLEEMLRPYRLPLQETVPLFAILLSLPLSEDSYPPLPWTPQRQRQKTLESIVAMLLELAERQPVLFILEDLHWTDPTTLELLDLLIDQTPTAALMTLLTCRPEFEPAWGLRGHLTPIALNRFTRTQIETMVDRVTDGKALPVAVMQHLVEKTDGVPLYVEEMTKAILEAGVLQATDDRYELTGPLTSFAIPSTLQDSLMARLDRLGGAKNIAQLGAVLGRTFPYALLQAVVSLDERVVSQSLAELVAADLLYQRGSLPDATFTFKHALLQEMAYEALLRYTRRQHHQRVAQALTERFAEVAQTQPELLAHHYTEAGDLEHAVDYWLRAGRVVFQRSANAEAIGHLSRGLALLEGLPTSPERDQRELDFQTVLGPALMAVKGQGSPNVGQVYARARELCQHVGETPQLLPVLFGLWRFYFMRSDHRTAQQVGEQCLRLAQRLHDSALRLPAHFTLGASQSFRGDDLVLAQTHLDQGIALYDAQAHRELAFRYGIDLGVWHLAYASMNLWFLGYPDQSLKRSDESLALAQELGHALSIAASLAYVTVLHVFRYEPLEAQRCAEETIAFATQQGFPQWPTLTMIYRGWALTLQGQAQDGLAQLRHGLEVWQALGHELGRNQYLFLLADAYRKAGQAELGLTAVAEGLEFTQQTEERAWEAELHRLQGELLQLLPTDHKAEAETCFHRALEVARHQHAKSWELRAATSLARLWQSQGKRQAAYDLLAPVYEWFTEGFDTVDLMEAKALRNELSEV